MIKSRFVLVFIHTESYTIRDETVKVRGTIMAKCELCNLWLGLVEEWYIEIPNGGGSLCLCKRCETNLNALINGTHDTERLKTGYWETAMRLKDGYLKGDKAEYVASLLDKNEAIVFEEERVKEANTKRNEEAQRRKERTAQKNAEEGFITTTSPQIEGYKITEYIHVISGEVVLGTGFLTDISGTVHDFLGTRSGKYENKLGEAKDYALNRVISRALDLGANAIIGVDFDITILGSNMIVVSANGTAVCIEKQ